MEQMLERPLKAFLAGLASNEVSVGPGAALALAGAAASALVGRAAAADRAVSEEVDAVRRRLEQMIETAREYRASAAQPSPSDPGAPGPDGLIELSRQAVTILDLATRTLGQTGATTAQVVAALISAVALARAAAEGAAQCVLADVPSVEDGLTRATLRTEAESLLQKVRRAEVDFAQARTRS